LYGPRWNLEQYIFHGAYPGAAELIDEPNRWRRYLLDSLIETTLSRDILLMTRVDKPALLRRLFQLGCAYSSQVLSYQKMIGQLTDAGNTGKQWGRFYTLYIYPQPAATGPLPPCSWLGSAQDAP
jgi:predicted AAA+ superfamily ATPase